MRCVKNFSADHPGLKARLVRMIVLAIVSAFGLMQSPTMAAATPTTMPVVNYREHYGVLAEHDIFMRDRTRHVRTPTSRSGFATPEQAYVLTGIVFEDGEYHAYLEDLQRSQSMKVRIGDPVARGQISDIQMDALQYQGPGGSTWIGIGNNLSGGEVGSVSDARIAAAASSGSSTQPSSMPANIANLSIEERMKLRRMQELSH
jgi:hypothetical protein